ncbi:MAG: AAA family ATPase [Patescibacteria group bacterium]
MLYFVTGVNGVGKSRFIKELINEREDFSHIQGSSELMKRLGIENGNYEKLRNFDEKIKNDIFERIIFEASEKYHDNLSEHAIVDGHVLNMICGKVVRAMSNNTLKLFSSVIYLHAETNEIIGRLEKDNSGRDRAIFEKKSESVNERQTLDDYQKQFEEILEKECLQNNILFYKILHLENRTCDSILIFSKIHEKILEDNLTEQSSEIRLGLNEMRRR